MFGQGFGAQVDIGFFQNLSGQRGNEVRFIPIFHNGYIYLLIKTGIVGVLVYLALLAWLYRVGRRTASGPPDDPKTLQGRALQGCALALLVSTWIVSGAFNKFGLVGLLLMVGHLLAALSAPVPEKTP